MVYLLYILQTESSAPQKPVGAGDGHINVGPGLGVGPGMIQLGLGLGFGLGDGAAGHSEQFPVFGSQLGVHPVHLGAQSHPLGKRVIVVH